MDEKVIDKKVIEIINGEIFLKVGRSKKEIDKVYVYNLLDIDQGVYQQFIDKTTLDMYDNYIFVTTRENGICQTKEIEPDRLLELLSLSRSERTVIGSGKFPKNDANIVEVYYEEPGNYKRVALLSPGGYGVMKSVSKEYQVEYPSMLFLLKMQGDKIIDTKIACVTEKSTEKITDNTRIYHYPFNHVSNFNVCWGTNQLPEVNNLNGLIIIPKIFLDSYHIAGHGAGQNRLGIAPEDLYKKLESKELSINDILVDAGLSYRELISKYL